MLSAADAPITGEYSAGDSFQRCLVTFEWDNTASKLSSRTVSYRLDLSYDKQQAGEAMRSAIAGINRAQSYGELGQASVFAGLLQKMASGKDSQQYKQALVMLSDILLNSNIDAEAFRRTLERGNVRTLLRPAAWSIWGKANLPTYAENALRGGSYAEMAEMMTAERDRLEREYDEQDRTRRRETAAEARDLSPGTVAVGI